MVTLNGNQLFDGANFTVQGQYVILASGTIGASDIVVIEQFTNSVVPEAMTFRIFQDMRGIQATYRITDSTTTTVLQDFTATANIAYMADVSKLPTPDLPNGIFGICTIGGERIMYRVLDTATNTISGLLRGTAGTAADNHYVGQAVYDMSRSNLLPENYQNYVVKNSTLGDGTTSVFYAPDIDVADFADSSTENQSIEVYVGGVKQYKYSDTSATSQYRWILGQFDPVTIEFINDDSVTPALTSPVAGADVTILVRQGVTWYQQGATTASNGIALQETTTNAARFLQGN